MILITGSKGQLGKDLQKLLKKKAIKFIPKSKKQLDISKPFSKKNFKNYNNIKIIINLAAYTKVDNAEIDKKNCNSVNINGVKNLVNLANNIDATLIQISSDYVFDGKSNVPYKELDQTNPINYYGKSKKKGEDAIIKSCRKYYIIRTSWVFSNNKNNFIDFIKKNLKNKYVKLINDQHGNPTSTISLSEVLYKLIKLIENPKKRSYGVYHFCNYPKTNWFEFGSYYVKNILKLKNISLIKISGKDLNLKAKRPKKSFLNSNKLSILLKLPEFDWRKQLKKI